MEATNKNKAAIIVKLKHDKGSVKIKVYTTSIDEAIDIVCKSEGAPKTAVIYAKVAMLTIYDIKRLSEAKAPYFFTRKTLNFFNQKMSDFSVTRQGNYKFYICARHPHGKTERIFNPFTGELNFINN